jgi:hypothetical protein
MVLYFPCFATRHVNYPGPQWKPSHCYSPRCIRGHLKVVGVTQALGGKMDAQVMVLQTKADLCGEQISEGWVPQHVARKAIDSMIWPPLQYPLPACNLTEQQGNQITKKLYRQILPSLGACRNFPLVYRYAPAVWLFPIHTWNKASPTSV